MTEMGGSGLSRGVQTERVLAEPVLGRWDYPAFILLSFLALAAITRLAVVWVRQDAMTHNPLLFLLLTSLFIPVLLNQQARWFLLPAMRRPRPMVSSKGLRVAVVTTYVPDAEPREMIEVSLAALVALEYPHDTWLLDEGGDPEMRAVCERLGVHYFSRSGRPEYQAGAGRFQSNSKHGNYNAWLDAWGFGRYDVLAAFDPDHIACPEFLTHVLGYFRDPRVAYVQPAQACYNQRASFIARGAAEETYGYYSMVQMASYGIGYPIIVGGHNVHRMKALKAVGGFAAHDADDLLLTLKFRAEGWQGVYVARILARGLAPVDWRGYLTQQRRWARSVLDIKLRQRAGYASKLPGAARVISFLHGINFLYRHVVAMFAFLFLLYMLMGNGPNDLLSGELIWPAALLFGALGLQELYRQRFYLDWRAERGLHWRAAVLRYASWPWFILALVEVLMRRRLAYAVTWKAMRVGRFGQFIGVQLMLVAAIAIAWIIGVILGQPAGLVIMVIAGLVIVGNLALIATEVRGFPPPWERRLCKAGKTLRMGEWHSAGESA